MENNTNLDSTGAIVGDFDAKKLFIGACFSLLTTAFAFTVIGAIAFSVKQEFVLTNAQLGVFTGVFFIGFTLSQFVFAPLCDTIGIRWIMRAAFVGHVGGVILLFLCGSYTIAVSGSLLCGLGAGLVEAGGNPLVASLYPKDKSAKLNRFHMWFPYGNLLAALITSLILSKIFAAYDIGWRGNLILVLVPALIYGFLLFFSKFPKTETASAGVSFGETLKECFKPLMIVMLLMMLLTASMELPPSTWVPPVLTSGGVDGLLVFGFIFGIMGTLRLCAAPILKALTPTGVLFGGAILGTLGLWLFSQAESLTMIFATAAVWAAGIALFWPTMLGFVSERVPKSGALGLGLMGAVGMLASFFVTPWLGGVADQKGHSQIPVTETVAIFSEVESAWPGLAAAAGPLKGDIEGTIKAVKAVADEYRSSNSLPIGSTAQALRAIVGTDVDSDVKGKASDILNPADNYGGKQSFKTLAPIGLVLIAVFGFLFFQDRRSGGYKAESIGGH